MSITSSPPNIELSMYSVTDESNNTTLYFDDDDALAVYINGDGDLPDSKFVQSELDLLTVVDSLLDELRSLLHTDVVAA